MEQCNECYETWFSEDGINCPRCGSSDTTELKQIKSTTHWPYVDKSLES